jgi:hypothetical protein
MVNTTIYALYIHIQSGKIPYPFTLCGIDSTDCAVPCNAYSLTTITVGDKKVRIYSDLDAGHFGQIPDTVPDVEKVRNMRKHMERTYNLLKHREGIEHIRMTSQQGVMAAITIARIAELLLESTGTRKTEKKEEMQQKLALGVQRSHCPSYRYSSDRE